MDFFHLTPEGSKLFISNTLGIIGLFVYIGYSFRGLKNKITGLHARIEAQKGTISDLEQHLETLKIWNKTLEVLPKGINTQIQEFKKINNEVIKKQKTLITVLNTDTKTKDEKIQELTAQNQQLTDISQEYLDYIVKIEKLLPNFLLQAANESVQFLEQSPPDQADPLTPTG